MSSQSRLRASTCHCGRLNRPPRLRDVTEKATQWKGAALLTGTIARSGHMAHRSAIRIRLVLAQDLVGDRGNVALAEEEIADALRDGARLGPGKVDVRDDAGQVADVKGEGR